MSNDVEYETLHPVLSLALPLIALVVAISPALVQLVLLAV